jgi:tRNA U34 5-carboxymethylaminomethyl modifying GTPase MnmE/TrmE
MPSIVHLLRAAAIWRLWSVLELLYSKLMKQLQGLALGELMAEDLRAAQQALNEITGEFTADDLLGKIFGSFCIGK